MDHFSGNPVIKYALDLVNSRASAVRRVRRLLPVGNTVYPARFVNGMLIEKRWIENESVDCVLLDSVASQANRIETAVYRAVTDGLVKLPDIRLETKSGLVVSIYQMPNRISDNALWDSEVNGIPFRETDAGRAFLAASQAAAMPLLDWSPFSLLLGYWRSTGERSSGVGNRQGRAMMSEVIGLNAIPTRKVASRSDPLGIRNVAEIYKKDDGGWTLDEKLASRDKNEKPIRAGNSRRKDGKPSSIGYGAIAPSFSEGGVSITEARQTIIVSLAAIRSLRFPDKDQAKCRAVLTALALCAVELALPETDHLRSGCDLFESGISEWKCVPDGTGQELHMTLESALECLRVLPDAAAELGANWKRDALILSPNPELSALIDRSMAQAGEDEEVSADGEDD